MSSPSKISMAQTLNGINVVEEVFTSFLKQKKSPIVSKSIHNAEK